VAALFGRLGEPALAANALGSVHHHRRPRPRAWGSLLVSALVLFAELFTRTARRTPARAARLLTHGP
jgi:hypothetical protein